MTTPAIAQRRVLVVEDEPLVCEAVKLLLAFDGHTVETAGNGQEGLKLFESGKYDLVITDYEMPKMKGDELAIAIKARNQKQPVIMITAHDEMLRATGNTLTGVDLLISKPFRLEDLRAGIAKVTSADSAKGGAGAS
jgi:CheY-like chemotaxis protein